MRTRRTPKIRARPRGRNEWLRVVESLDVLLARRASPEAPKAGKAPLDRNTVDALNAAYAVTSRYYTALLAGGQHDRDVQEQISQSWQKAGRAMRRLHPALTSELKASNPFWSSEVTWNKETIQKAWAHLNSIRTSTNILSPAQGALQSWSTFSSS